MFASSAALKVAQERWWPLALGAQGLAIPGLRVDGTALGLGLPAAGQIEARALGLARRRVKLVVREPAGVRVVAEPTFGSLGVSVDVQAVTSRALRLGRAGDILARARLADKARRGAIDLPLQPRVESSAAVEALLPIKEELDSSPVAARFDVSRRSIVPEREGQTLDVDAAIASIRRAAAADTKAEAEIELPLRRVSPHVTGASIATIDVSRLITSFATHFSRRGDQAERARNIEVAGSHIDGLVIEPGDLVSFNDVVGSRSEDNGFRKAFEIYKGEMVEGTGGGTCQVASTLHAIAFFGGLDVVERLPHSRPSAYIPVGLDATVVYPVVDLKLRNPYSFPVVVHAVVEANTLTMELLGADKPARVALMRTVLSTTPFDRKVVEDPAVSTPRRKQKGSFGIKLLRKRVIALRAGGTRVETSRDNYPPTMEVWKVPPGFDTGDLPALGEDVPSPDPAEPPTPPATSDPEETIWGR